MADRKVRVILEAAVSGFQSQMATASKSVGDAADKMTGASRESEKFRRGLDELGSTAGKVGLAAAAGLAAVTKTAIDWESAWAGVTKTVDGSASQMATLEDQLRGLARELPASHQEIAAVAEAAGQLGIQRESVAGFAETMIALGETTNLSAEQAATSIARFSNIMGTSADEVDRIGSALVDLGNNSATTEAEILELGTRLAAAGEIAGLSEADVLAFAATLTSVGVEAEAGGTALSKVFTSVRDAALDGGDKLETFAEVAGVTTSEFQRAFSEDAAGAVEMFISGLGRVNEAGESTSGIFKALGLTDQRLTRALLSTASAGDLLSGSLELGSKAWDENTALAAEAEKRYETTAAQIQVAWNRIRDAAIEVGASVLPIVAEVAEGAGAIADAFGALPDPAKKATAALLGITAVTGGAAWFGSKVIRGISDTRGALRDLGLTAANSRGKLASLSNLARVSAGLGAVALAATDLDEDLGVANTAAYALYGTMLLPGWGTAIGAGIGVISDFGASSEEAAKKIDALGASLDTAVDSGDMRKIREAASAIQELADSLPDDLPGPLANNGAIQALRDQERAADQALRGVHDYAFGLDVLNDVVGQYPEEARKLQAEAEKTAAAQEEVARAAKEEAEAHKKAREAAREQGEGWLNLSEAAGDTKKSLGEFLTELEKQGQALANFTENAQKAGRRGLRQGLIDHLEELGPAGARRMEQLANASDEEIGRANRAWRKWINSLDEYTDMNVPPKKPEVDPKQAKTAIRQIRRGLIELGLMKAEPKITVDNSQALAALAAVANSLGALGAPLGLAATLLAATGANQPKGGGKSKPKGDGRIAPSSTPRGDRVFTEQLGARSPSYAAPAAPAGGTTGGGEIDYDRLASTLSAARPLVGTQIVQPHNYNEFRRQEDKNRRLANLGG